MSQSSGDPAAVPVVADPLLVEQISDRGDRLRSRVAELTDRDVRIVCVTKGHPPVVAASAVEAGFADLGENYAQELRDKEIALRDKEIALRDKEIALRGKEMALREAPAPLRWHFIGRLQTNKVRVVADVVALWQSVDRVSLAEQIARRSPGASVLVQVDLAGIEGRGGCPPGEVAAVVRRCSALGLDVRGLMGVAPPGEPEEARPGFRLLERTAGELGLVERSMGMSGDLEVAVQEGATILRIGSALVGPRSSR